MNTEFVIQFVQQKMILYYSMSNNRGVKKLPVPSGEVSRGTDEKGDFRTMGRDIFIRVFTDKDRKRGVVYGEDNFNDGGERFVKP